MNSSVKSAWVSWRLLFGISFVLWLFVGFTFAKEVYVFVVGEHASIVSAESSNVHIKRETDDDGDVYEHAVCDITYSWYDTNGDLQYTVDRNVDLDFARHTLADKGEHYPVIYYMKDNPDNYTLVFNSNIFVVKVVVKGFCYLLSFGFVYMFYKIDKELSEQERRLDSATRM